MVGRAQRVTDVEYQSGYRLPATVLNTDEPGLRGAFADVLIGLCVCLRCRRAVPPLRADDFAWPLWPRSKICWRCGQSWLVCVCLCDMCEQPRSECVCHPASASPGTENPVTIDMDGDLENSAAHFNGEQVNLRIRDLMAAELVDMGQSPVHAEALALASDRVRRAQPWVFHQKDEQP